QVAGTGLVASYFLDVVSPKLLYGATAAPNVALKNSAKSCIFIFFPGAPSHVDTWDFKEGSWTPSDFAPDTFGGGNIRFPKGLMPKTAEHIDRLAFVRSGLSWAAVHQLGQSWAQIARNPGRATGALGKHANDMNNFYDSAKTLMDAPGINNLFAFSTDDHTKYGSSDFGDSLIVARNLVNARKGTRFVQATFGGWDHHSDIYDKTAASSLYTQSAAFDPAFAALMTDLKAMPGSVSGKTLLDETLVVIVAEFGRTTGALNNQGGRDHFLRMSTVWAGGGIRGGRAIGVTDSVGSGVTDYGWSAN